MNVEKTMQFILETQAQFEAAVAKNVVASERRFGQAEKRLDRIERVLGQTNRVLAGLASRGVNLRGDTRRHEKWLATHELVMTEMGEKLDGLIDVVDKMIRKNGRR
ncbi:MAG TPA: hypothetical protein VL523_17550 [Terriglobia bacterium]|nr:hypothetical protein [Terriglobia bacterium]